MKQKSKLFIVVFLFILSGINVFAQPADGSNNKSEFQSQGELLFKQNKTQDAVEVLEYEILNGQISENTYNILGLAYYQLGDYEKSVDAFKRGLKYGNVDVKIINYNLGNTFYAMKDYNSAKECYSLALVEDDKFYDAILNRANALLMSDQLKTAHDQYVDYLKKNPTTEQKDSIEQMIQALEEEIARREEEARLLAEKNKSVWEEYDASITENQSGSKGPKWEKVENEFKNKQITDESSQWEPINYDEKTGERKDYENLAGEKKWENIGATDNGKKSAMTKKTDWEHIDSKIAEAYKNEDDKHIDFEQFKKSLQPSDLLKANGEYISDEELEKYFYENYKSDRENGKRWSGLSDEDILELEELDADSKAAHQRWLNEQKRIKKQKEEEALKQKKLEDEKRKLENRQLIEDMMEAEDKRRKKLLDDMANSLQNSDNANKSSGTENAFEYDIEGELD